MAHLSTSLMLSLFPTLFHIIEQRIVIQWIFPHFVLILKPPLPHYCIHYSFSISILFLKGLEFSIQVPSAPIRYMIKRELVDAPSTLRFLTMLFEFGERKTNNCSASLSLTSFSIGLSYAFLNLVTSPSSPKGYRQIY